jgi:hypothetical protein
MNVGEHEHTCGERGCCGLTDRRGHLRHCAQKAVTWDAAGRGWCYYHNPEKPRKFGQGYGWDEDRGALGPGEGAACRK